MIYMDYASHTPVDPDVLEKFCQAEKEFIGNPSARHSAGYISLDKMKEITNDISDLLDLDSYEIIYTSGASEANNLALKGLAKTYRHTCKHILSTCLEHPSVSGTLTALQEQEYEIELIDILEDGTIDLESFQELLRDDTGIVTIVMVDSELGAIQPIEKIVEILKNYPNCHLHVDATQAVGKIPVCVEGIDSMSFSPHKFYGICGSGVLVKHKDIVIEPLIHGGLSTTIYRSGTPALSLAVSVHAALDLAINNQGKWLDDVKNIRKRLISELTAFKAVRINSPKYGSPYILNLSVKNIKGEDFQKALDERGICVSVKSACSAIGIPSRPVFAVSKDRKNAFCSWRLSLSHLTTQDEIESFLQAFEECYKELIK